MVASRWPWRPRRSRAAWMSRSTSSPACNYLHLSTPNQRLAGFVQIVPLCAELFEGPPRQATLSGSNIDRSRNYNGPCGWSEMWVIARVAVRLRERPARAAAGFQERDRHQGTQGTGRGGSGSCMPLVPGPRLPAADPVREALAELEAPLPHGLVADGC